MNKKRLTIGYLTSSSFEGIQIKLTTGILEAAKKFDVNLLCFSGSSQGDLYQNDEQANKIFNLVSPSIVDGIIFWASGFYQNYNFLFDIENLLKINQKIPFISIGEPVKNFPTLQMDNKDGIFKLISHLVEVHGYKKIAFVKGPEYHIYANIRYQAYLEALKKYNIPIDQRLISIPGHFEYPTGEKAAQYFFNELKLKPKTDIEAIASASDLLSIGAIREMKKIGINVPKNVAVVGFNNREEGIQITPELTTVDSYFIKIGNEAVKTILSLINKNENVPREIYIPVKLIIRNSCGCQHSAFFSEKNPIISVYKDNTNNISDINSNLKKNKNFILNELNSYILNIKESEFDKEWSSSLLNSFINEISSDLKYDFIDALENILEKFLTNYYEIPVWQDIITKMRILILPLINNSDMIFKAENIFHNARVLILQKLKQAMTIDKMQTRTREDIFPSISNAIVSTFDITTLLPIIENALPRLGISACYISLYVNPEKPLDKAELIMAYDENGHIDVNGVNTIFSIYDLVPEGVLQDDKRYEILVKPLFFHEEQLGFILFRIGVVDTITYITMQSYISSALQGAKLVRSINERAIELEKTYLSLKDKQERLVISEKMASLGKLTAGIAHEINTPLATVQTSIKELETLVDEYKKSIDNPDVLSSDHKSIVQDMEKYLKLSNHSLEKVIEFIKAIKGQTYDSVNKNIQAFNAVSVISNNLNLLEHLFKKNNCNLVFVKYDSDIKFIGDPRFLNQIVTNLITNAVDACKPNGGTISVILKKIDSNNSELIVEDTGPGISKENLNKIFEPFFTTKPFGEGTGLGLSIVHELVKEFNGHIDVKSAPGQTKFRITLPYKL